MSEPIAEPHLEPDSTLSDEQAQAVLIGLAPTIPNEAAKIVLDNLETSDLTPEQRRARYDAQRLVEAKDKRLNTKRLTSKERKFVTEYLKDVNCTQAAIRCGLASGYHILNRASVKSAIERSLAKRAGRAALSAEKTLIALKEIGFSDIGDILDFSGPSPRMRPAHEITPAARRAIASCKVRRIVERRIVEVNGLAVPVEDTVEVTEFKLWDKLSALTTLAKYLGLLTSKSSEEQHAMVESFLASLPERLQELVREKMRQKLQVTKVETNEPTGG